MVETLLGLFLIFSGYIIGLGAVTVIDLHGFLGRKSTYWTRATITTHKVTKPLIWIGTVLMAAGTIVFYSLNGLNFFAFLHWGLIAVLVLNGLFLSFWVSPRLLKKEKEGRAEELLPQSMQNAIAVSFVISVLGWWGSLFLFTWYLASLVR